MMTFEQACDLADEVSPMPSVAHEALLVLRKRCNEMQRWAIELRESNPQLAMLEKAYAGSDAEAIFKKANVKIISNKT